MSIAELIMQGTKRSSESTAWVGESLAKLGQNVGAALAQKEAQSQAQAVLPVLQATYKSAFDKIGQGNLSEGYGDLMNAQLQFGASNNPFIQNMNQQMAAMSKQFADDYLRKSQISAYQSRSSGRSGGGFEVPSFEEMDDSTSLVDANQPTTLDATVGGSYDILDQENAQNLPKDQPSGFSAGLRSEQTPFSFGMETGNASLYVADEKTKNKAVSAIQDYKSSTPDQKSEVVGKIVDTSNQPPADSIRVNLPGLGQGFITGPSMEQQQEVTGVKRTQRVSQKSGLERQEEKTYSQKEKTQAQKAFEGFAQNSGVASAMFNQNKQLRDIMEMAGGDITQITTDDDVIEDINGKQVPVKRVFVKGQDAGTLSMERPMGDDGKPDPRRMSEAQAVETIIDAPGIIERFGWKFYPQQGEKPTATEAPAQQQMSREEQVKQAQAILGGTKATKQKPVKELSIEEQLSQEASSVNIPAGRTATPEQLKGVEKSKISQNKSTLESEKRKLESLLYDVARATGKKTLKAGISTNTKSKAEARIAQINKELEGL